MTTGSVVVTRGLKRLANLANIGPTFLELNSKLSYDQWAGLGPVLGAMHGASRWWIGDWIRAGERAYGEKYVQAIDGTGLSLGTLQNAVWVANRFDQISRRREVLSFEHHVAVASLEEEAANRLLAEAEKKKWKLGEIRKAVATYKRENDLDDAPDPVPEGQRAAAREWRAALGEIRSMVDPRVREAKDPELTELHKAIKAAIERLIAYCERSA